MINLKDKKINSVFLGNKKINKVLLGNKVVFTGEIVKYLNLGNIELCRIDNYQDYLFKQNGKWYKHTTIIKTVLNGSEDGWYISHSGDEYWAYRLSIDLRTLAISAAQKGYSNLYGRTDINNSNTNQGIFYSYNNKQVCIRYGTEDTIENFKAFLAQNNLIIYGKAENPYDIEITDSNLINQLEELYQALSYGTATVESEPEYVPLIIDNNMVKGNTSQNSTRGVNLFNHYDYPVSRTLQGVTITNNGDGSFTLNGTSTSNQFSFPLGLNETIKNLGKNNNLVHTLYYISGSCVKGETSGANRNVIRLNYNQSQSMIHLEQLENSKIISKIQYQYNYDEGWSWEIILSTGDSFDNFTVKYQLEIGDEATDYEPYTGGQPSPNPDYPQSIKNGGGNNKITII